MSETHIRVFIPSHRDIYYLPLNKNPVAGILVQNVWQLLRLYLGREGIDFSQLSLRSLHHSVPMAPLDAIRERVQNSSSEQGFDTLSPTDQVSTHRCDPAENVRLYLHIDQGSGKPNRSSDMRVAEKLHETLWGKEFKVLLEEVSDDEGTTWKYVPRKYIDSLEMSALGYPEGALLVRAQYDAALKKFDPKAASKRGCGVVIKGQSGTGKSCFLYYLLIRKNLPRKSRII